MYLLDTDILTLVHAGHPRVAAFRQTIDSRDIATTIVTRLEILRGRFDAVLKAADSSRLLKAQELLRRSELLLNELRIVPFDTDAAHEFDRLKDDKRLRKIGRADLLIASIALAQRAVLVTRNTRHLGQVPGLRLANWAG